MTPIDLFQAEWSIVSYLRDTPMPVDQALGSISSPLQIAKNGFGQVYWPNYGVNQIGEMLPGAGYQVYLDDSGTLTYPSN